MRPLDLGDALCIFVDHARQLGAFNTHTKTGAVHAMAGAQSRRLVVVMDHMPMPLVGALALEERRVSPMVTFD